MNPDQAVSATPRSALAALQRLTPRAKVALAMGVAALVAILAASWMWSAPAPDKVLFTNLSDRDGGAIIAQLAQMNIPYRHTEGGTLLVPADQVHEARLKLASAGLPKGSLVGFELMENQKFGATQFQEQVNYQRGLEGELTRSIQSLAPVDTARIHLALPKASGFLRDKQPPTASVVLQLHPGRSLDRAQVAGIIHLVSSSVPELNPKNVTVVDQHGSLLSGATRSGGLDAAQLDYVNQIEAGTIRRIHDILEPIVGRANVRAQVTADVDFSQSERTAETYTPNQGPEAAAAVRSTQSSESSQPSARPTGGIPGALSNQPPAVPSAPINGPAPALNPTNAAGAAAANAATRRDAVTNFEVDKNVVHTRSASGQIRRLTAAVVVNHRVAQAADGSTTATPLSDAELQNLQALVREAMGFSAQRGDSLNVLNAAFDLGTAPLAADLQWWERPEFLALAKDAGIALLLVLLALIVVFGVLRPALRAARPSNAETPAALLDGSGGADDAIDVLPMPSAAELRPSPLEEVRRIAREDPATVANVVRVWANKAAQA